MHVMLAVCDHFEPLSPRKSRSTDVGRQRVARWACEYPRLAEPFRDADGHPPRHTFFFPAEDCCDDFLTPLAELTAAGLGEVEIHLHHSDDTPDSLHTKLMAFRDRLRNDYGLLGSDPRGRPRYAFIHGNWALCNSLPNGDWCGVNEELGVLAATGCYADFTFPAVPSPAQPHMVNCIYRAADRPGRPRGHDRGTEVRAFKRGMRNAECGTQKAECRTRERIMGEGEVRNGKYGAWQAAPVHGQPSGLLLIPGPLALNWRWRKWGLLPRIEHADVSAACPPTPARLALWLRQHIHVRGRPEWIFVKLHTHGCIEANTEVLLGQPMRDLHATLARVCRPEDGCCLHYVTAREMANIVFAAEAGITGNPGGSRNAFVSPPPRTARSPVA